MDKYKELTAEKIEEYLKDIFSKRSSKPNIQVIGGTGYNEALDNAIKNTFIQSQEDFHNKQLEEARKIIYND